MMENCQGACGKVIGQFSDGKITDETWKCSLEYFNDWDKVTFDDRLWPPAVDALDMNLADYSVLIENQKIFGAAKWIHSIENNSSTNNLTYCRKHLGNFLFYSKTL